MCLYLFSFLNETDQQRKKNWTIAVIYLSNINKTQNQNDKKTLFSGLGLRSSSPFFWPVVSHQHIAFSWRRWSKLLPGIPADRGTGRCFFRCSIGLVSCIQAHVFYRCYRNSTVQLPPHRLQAYLWTADSSSYRLCIRIWKIILFFCLLV